MTADVIPLKLIVNYLAGLFSILGILVHIRNFRFLGDPVLIDRYERLQNGSELLMDKLLFLAAPWNPYIFYIACFGFCFLAWRNRLTVAMLLMVMLLSVPYFSALNELHASIARTALYAGGFTIFYHMTRFTRQASGKIDTATP
ncbi:hypothetical protein Poly51_59780 [Rubripirellula tenax]|uniref:Uncharacterized protein n=1 Tax=Rubripirellula tenax TaxID=2528015 RepID=A0A5C6EC38_9BACT|nr:hypothetical protein Poly51_59780 [Rubripirellula tenax]